MIAIHEIAVPVAVAIIGCMGAVGAAYVQHAIRREIRPRYPDGSTNGLTAGQVLMALYDHSRDESIHHHHAGRVE